MHSLPAPLAALTALAGRLHERHGRALPAAATALLAIMLGWALAQLLWALLPTPLSAQWRPMPAVAATTSNDAGNRAGAQAQAIANAHLFGVYQAPSNPNAAALDRAPDTALNLTLMGILAGTNEHDSRALIAQQTGDESAYAIGKDIVSGVTLQAIFPDRVILSRSGVLETLRLDKDAPSKTSGAPIVETSAAAPSAGLQLAQIREQVLTDPNKAGDYIRVQPANNGSGGVRGYRIYPGKDRTVFNAAALRPGDLVTAINGIQLDDEQRALQVLSDLKNAGNATLTVERGGQPQTINVNLNP